MQFFSQFLLLAQISQDDLQREALRLQHDYQFLSYGLTAAWVIMVVYVLLMVGRQRRLKREIASLRAMLEQTSKQVSSNKLNR